MKVFNETSDNILWSDVRVPRSWYFKLLGVLSKRAILPFIICVSTDTTSVVDGLSKVSAGYRNLGADLANIMSMLNENEEGRIIKRSQND
jgi:hypothetical protein